jgi:hypothetical protein
MLVDNALAESFFGALKNELIHRTAFPTKKQARRGLPNTSRSSTIGPGYTPG